MSAKARQYEAIKPFLVLTPGQVKSGPPDGLLLITNLPTGESHTHHVTLFSTNLNTEFYRAALFRAFREAMQYTGWIKSVEFSEDQTYVEVIDNGSLPDADDIGELVLEVASNHTSMSIRDVYIITLPPGHKLCLVDYAQTKLDGEPVFMLTFPGIFTVNERKLNAALRTGTGGSVTQYKAHKARGRWEITAWLDESVNRTEDDYRYLINRVISHFAQQAKHPDGTTVIYAPATPFRFTV